MTNHPQFEPEFDHGPVRGSVLVEVAGKSPDAWFIPLEHYTRLQADWWALQRKQEECEDASDIWRCVTVGLCAVALLDQPHWNSGVSFFLWLLIAFAGADYLKQRNRKRACGRK